MTFPGAQDYPGVWAMTLFFLSPCDVDDDVFVTLYKVGPCTLVPIGVV